MRWLTPSLLMASLFLSTTAAAYVLPPGFLMRMLIDKRHDQKIKDLSIQLNSELIATQTSMDEHLYLKQPQRLRRVAEGEGGGVYVEKEGVCGIGTAERVKRQKCAVEDLIATLFVPGEAEYEELSKRMVAGLKKAGIDIETVALGRDEKKRFIYIIGARPFEPEKPQIWLSKDSYLPLRLRTKGAAGVIHEVRFLEYGSELAGNWFPKVMEAYENGKLVRRSEITKIKINQNLPESMFAIP